jgi:hypothetical protein
MFRRFIDLCFVNFIFDSFYLLWYAQCVKIHNNWTIIGLALLMSRNHVFTS